MTSKDKTYEPHNMETWSEPVWEQVPGLNAPAIDFKLLKNRGTTGGSNYAVLDFWATAGATGDGTYRVVNLGGVDGDLQTAYTSYTLLTGLGTMDYKLTRVVSGVSISGNDISVPAGKTCRISCYPSGANHNVRITVTGGSLRYLVGGSLDFTGASGTTTFINASTSDASFTIKYATGAANRPIFGLFIEIF